METFLSLYLPSVTLALGQGIALPALPVYARSFGVSFEVAALVLIVQSLGGMIAGVPIGLLIDKIGRRRVILAAPMVEAASSFLTASAQSFPELVVYRFLAGFALSMWMLGRLTIITDTGGDNQRGKQITGMSAMESAGRLIGPAIGGFVATAWGLQVPFVIHGFICLLVLIPCFKLIREPARAPRRPGTETPTQRGIAGMLGSYAPLFTIPILMFFIAQLLASITRGALFGGTLNVYAVYTYDISAKDIGLLATVATAIGIPITILSGGIMDRYGRKATLVPGFSALSVALFLMAVTAYMDWPYAAYFVAFLLVQAALTVTSGNMMTLGSDIAPPHMRGKFFGVWRIANDGGSVISPSLFAILTASAGNPFGFVFLATTAVASALVLALLVQDPVRQAIQARRLAESTTGAAGG
jgi:MFS family permease